MTRALPSSSRPRSARQPRRGQRDAARVAAVAVLSLAAVAVAWLVLDGAATPATPATPRALADSARRDAKTMGEVARASTVDGREDGTLPAPTSSGVQALGADAPTGRFGPEIPVAGRTAGLELRVTCRGVGAAASATVVAGADAGRAFATDADGVLCLDDLVPGLAVVEVVATTGDRARREVLLRHRGRSELALDFGDHGTVAGDVRDEEGRPVSGARVEVDGQEGFTDGDGAFALPRTTADGTAITVRRAGFATCRVPLPAAGAPAAPVRIALPPACRLTVSAPSFPGGADDVQLVLVPTGEPRAFVGGRLQSTYPWSALQPLQLAAGGTLVLDDLPACRVDVVAWHARADGRPLSAWLRPEQPSHLDVLWEPRPAVRVSVMRGDQVVEGARVTLDVANPTSERLKALGEHRRIVDLQALGCPPRFAARERSDADGLALLPRPRREGFVTVTDEAGAVTVVRRVDAGTERLVVDLARPDA